MAPLATKKAWEDDLKSMLVEGNFLKGHNFDQVFLLAVTYERNNNLIVFSYAIVTFETDDKLVWFRHQLEQDFHSLVSL